MEPLFRQRRRIAATILVSIYLSACGRGDVVGPETSRSDRQDRVANGALQTSTPAERVLHVGQQVQLRSSTSRPTRAATWGSSNVSVVSVSSTGVVTGHAAGVAFVTVSGFGVGETFRIVVLSGPRVTTIAVSPKSGAALAPGQTRQFTSVVSWSDGMPRAASVSYTATGGTISSTGLFTAGQWAGAFLVIATCSCGLADTAVASVASLSSLSVTPASATVAPGASRQFTVSATWSNGATVTPTVTFSASGGSRP